MINAQLSGPGFNFKGGGFLGSLKRGIALIAAFGVGALVLMAAGVLAVATAIIGVIIAFVAMLLRFGAFKQPAMQRQRATATATGDTVLEARRTARGWTVDG